MLLWSSVEHYGMLGCEHQLVFKRHINDSGVSSFPVYKASSFISGCPIWSAIETNEPKTRMISFRIKLGRFHLLA